MVGGILLKKGRYKMDTIWYSFYGLLLEFIDEHIRLPIGREVYHGADLGNWVTLQRRFYRRRQLPPSHIRALEEVPGWFWTELELKQ